MMVLFQYAVGKDGDIQLYEVWNEPVYKTLELFEALTKHVVVGFNLVFDWFHVQKIHSVWSKLPKDWIPAEHINEIADVEMDARDGLCLKPYSALDLLLHSRKGPYQSLMARNDIRIRRIPLTPVKWKGRTIPMAYAVAEYLEEQIEFEGIYFAKRSDSDAPYWAVFNRVKDNVVDTKFADVVLKFNPDGSLKSLAEHALGLKPKYKHEDIELDKSLRPIELGYAPFARAISTPEKNWESWGRSASGMETLKGFAWPGVISHHIKHWNENLPARDYANDDIVYTRGLYYHFDEPAHGDNDSILSCMVPSVRWRGFSVDLDGVKGLRKKAVTIARKSPINTNAAGDVRDYINAKCNMTEKSFLEKTTDKARLQEMSQWLITEDEECMECFGGLEEGCKVCDGEGVIKRGIHPAAKRAKEVLNIKVSKKEIELYNKLLKAGRFHASFKITGTLSNRMAGGDGLNAQGINHDPAVRKQFPLVWDGYVLCGGDFDSFEVTIADAVYNDLDLRTTIVSGKKLHGLFGQLMFPGYTYEQILDSDENPDDYEFGNMYGKAKAGVFAMIYGGNASTLNKNQGIPMKVAEEAYFQWGQMFPGIGKTRDQVQEMFQPLRQEGGIGTNIEWVEPKEYVESFLGFRRYYTLEYKIVRAIIDLAQDLPKEWKDDDVKVVRSEKRGEQKAWGALSSALYGAGFGIAERIVRASANHQIQSPGAELTKDTQVAIWSLQPVGVHEFNVAPMNVHDEVISVTKPEFVKPQSEIVQEKVESYRDKVPLIGMKWCLDMANWAEKKGGEGNLVHITYDKDRVLEELEEAKAAA